MFTPFAIDVTCERFPWASLALVTGMAVATGTTEGTSVEELAHEGAAL